jgi:hypothetical protein
MILIVFFGVTQKKIKNEKIIAAVFTAYFNILVFLVFLNNVESFERVKQIPAPAFYLLIFFTVALWLMVFPVLILFIQFVRRREPKRKTPLY